MTADGLKMLVTASIIAVVTGLPFFIDIAGYSIWACVGLIGVVFALSGAFGFWGARYAAGRCEPQRKPRSPYRRTARRRMLRHWNPRRLRAPARRHHAYSQT